MIKLKRLLLESVRDQLDQFTKGYIDCALATSDTGYIYQHGPEKSQWDTEYDEEEPYGEEEHPGEQMSKHYDVEDICPETMMDIVKDCKDFQAKYHEFYEAAGWNPDMAGYDFWLTRNHHGAGFWDRNTSTLYSTELYQQGGQEAIKKVAKVLTDAAHSYGEYHLYLGDGSYDGWVCGSKG